MQVKFHLWLCETCETCETCEVIPKVMWMPGFNQQMQIRIKAQNWSCENLRCTLLHVRRSPGSLDMSSYSNWATVGRQRQEPTDLSKFHDFHVTLSHIQTDLSYSCINCIFLWHFELEHFEKFRTIETSWQIFVNSNSTSWHVPRGGCGGGGLWPSTPGHVSHLCPGLSIGQAKHGHETWDDSNDFNFKW